VLFLGPVEMVITSVSSEMLASSVAVRMLGALLAPYIVKPDVLRESFRKIDGALLDGAAVAGRMRLKASLPLWGLPKAVPGRLDCAPPLGTIRSRLPCGFSGRWCVSLFWIIAPVWDMRASMMSFFNLMARSRLDQVRLRYSSIGILKTNSWISSKFLSPRPWVPKCQNILAASSHSWEKIPYNSSTIPHWGF